MALQQRISREINAAKVGRTFKVLIDRTEGSQFVGRTEYDSPEVDNKVYVDAKKHYLRLGDFADLRVTSAADYDLTAAPV